MEGVNIILTGGASWAVSSQTFINIDSILLASIFHYIIGNIRTAHKYGKLPSDCFVLVAIFRVQSSLFAVGRLILDLIRLKFVGFFPEIRLPHSHNKLLYSLEVEGGCSLVSRSQTLYLTATLGKGLGTLVYQTRSAGMRI